ncbi:MAG: NfeD family protein [Andreesenia angusta]|nr:NfeD family protein [Andreesenia angusta]
MELFENISPVILWLVIAVVFAVVEAISLGITSIWFVFGAIAAMVLAFFDTSIVLQISAFLIISILLLIFTRPILVEKFKLGKEKTNIDAIIGQEALVKEDIDNIRGKGQVVIKGQIWSARSTEGENIEKDKKVVVERIEGVKVIVREIK